MSLNKILPIHKACLNKKGAFKPYSRVHVSKGRAMATNGRVAVVWNLAKLQQVGEKNEEEEVFTEEVIQYLEGKSITSQYWEALTNAKEVYVVKDGERESLEIIQEGRHFTLSYIQPPDKEVYIEQIVKMVKIEADISKTDNSCMLWDDLDIVKKSLGVSATTKMNFVFNGNDKAIKIIPENGYDCFAIFQPIGNETNMFILEEFQEFISDFLTVGDSFTVKIGAVQKEKEDAKKELVDQNQVEAKLEIVTDDVLELEVETEEEDLLDIPETINEEESPLEILEEEDDELPI